MHGFKGSSCKLDMALALILMGAIHSSCGANLFKATETADPAEDATLALEKGKEDEAIDILQEALKDDPSNGQFLSILAAAYAQRAGIEPLAIAQRMSSNDSSSSGSGITSMFGLVPAATIAVLADIDKAVDILTVQMTEAQKQPGDDFKIAIYQTSALVLHTKILDKNGDGVISPSELIDLSSGSAIDILNNISSAQAVFAEQGASSASSEKLAEKLAGVQSGISASEGASEDERLRNYLGSSSQTKN